MRIPFVVLLIMILGAGPVAALGDDATIQVQRLPLGEGEERFQLVRVPLNGFVSSRVGGLTTSEKAFRELAAARVIVVGEGHTNEQHHLLQLKIIRGLHERGRKVAIALEMFNPAQNQALADFSAGRIDEAEFLRVADWVNVWGHDYRYYRPIFLFAREQHLPVVGVNLPHHLVSKVAMGGLAGLSEAEARGMPVPEMSSREHRFLVNSMMQGIEALSPEIFESLYTSQCLWDAAMGDGAIRTAGEYPDHAVVVLAGTGHVAYGLGIPRIIRRRSGLPVMTVLPVDVTPPEPGKKEDPFEVHLRGHGGDATFPHELVTRTLADILVGVPAEKHEKYPTLGIGIRTEKTGGVSITRVMPGSLAEKAGLSKGELLLRVDGKPLVDATALKAYLGTRNWGDALVFELKGPKGRRTKTVRLMP